ERQNIRPARATSTPERQNIRPARATSTPERQNIRPARATPPLPILSGVHEDRRRPRAWLARRKTIVRVAVGTRAQVHLGAVSLCVALAAQIGGVDLVLGRLGPHARI